MKREKTVLIPSLEPWMNDGAIAFAGKRQKKEIALAVQGDSSVTVWTGEDSDFPVDTSTGQMGIHVYSLGG